VSGRLELNKDGHLITEDSVLPTTAPGGAPEQNRCYQTPATLFDLPLAPASLARSARLAPLTSLRPRWGLARLVCYGVGRYNPKSARIAFLPAAAGLWAAKHSSAALSSSRWGYRRHLSVGASSFVGAPCVPLSELDLLSLEAPSLV